MLNINKKAFTLVELIVVITILAILGTIGFISLQGYSSEARDSKRVTDLGQLRTGIQVYQAKEGVAPEPSETKTIIGSGTTNLIIQGYAGTGTLRSIKVNTDAKDPLEDNYYTYSTNGSKTKFQLLALLENNNTAYNVIPTTYANYETRDLYTVGNKLGILLDSATNTPVQELGETSIDLNTNSTEYKAVFSKSDIQTLSGTLLYKKFLNLPLSCKDILDNNKSTGDGNYNIYPGDDINPLEVYCDMTTDGGGWTRMYYKQGANTCFNIDNSNISLNGVKNILTSDLGISDDLYSLNKQSSWVLENLKFDNIENFSFNKVLSTINCKTPTDTSWSQDYIGGYLFYRGALNTFGDWTSIFNGCGSYVNVGQEVNFRIGGGANHNGEFIHTVCNDYTVNNSPERVTSRWNWDNTRVFWFR